MPYTEKAHRYFEALAHGMKPRDKNAPSAEEAKKLAGEGVKGKKSKMGTLYKKDK